MNSTNRLHDRLLEESLNSYRHHGIQAVPYWETKTEGAFPDLLIPKLRRAEEIETEETLPNFDYTKLSRYISDGLEVWVLVPLSSMHIAHSQLRGYADRIQPWWFE